MSTHQFAVKSIRVTVTLNKGESCQTKVLENLPMDAVITKLCLPDRNSVTLKVQGLAEETMRQLTMLSNRPLDSDYNEIEVEAIDGKNTAVVLFSGEVTTALADFNSAPDPVMTIKALAGFYFQQKSSPPVSVKGELPAAELVAIFAGEMDYSFINEGVTASVRNAVFEGSPVEKAMRVAQQVGAELLLDDGCVVLKPANVPRKGDPIFISKNSGLIGYPTFGEDGLSLSTYLNPALGLKGLVELSSLVPGTDGLWMINKLSHSITANQTAGRWQTDITVSPYVEEPGEDDDSESSELS